MLLISNLSAWRTLRRGPEFNGRTVGFVPTMGALHRGHVSLLERARRENDRVVLSIFVNPTQFNDASDLARYPRTLDADLALAKELADWVIVPESAALYPDDYRYRVTESALSKELEGVHRPGHFDGVLTVVLKLLNLVAPSRAYFGEKDWQQLELIRGLAAALFLPVDIVACPTIREDDGLAMSSRNRRLSPEGRIQAAFFPRILRSAPDADTATRQLHEAGFEVDYVTDRDGARLGAIRLEGIRLIDHVRL